MIKEEWKDVRGYEGLYQVSNYGNIKSYDKQVWNGKAYFTMKGKDLKLSKTTTGYWKVGLYKNKTQKNHKVHRLVAFAFIDKVKGKTTINHKDGKPLNNYVDNLEWCTQSENMQHAYDTNLMDRALNESETKEVIDEYIRDENITMSALSIKHKCSEPTISRLLRRNSVEVRDVGHYQNKYNIDRKELVKMFNSGERNIDISKKLSASYGIIAIYRHKYNKGELII